MRRAWRLFSALLGIAALAAVAWANDPWKDKPYQQWDKKDVAKILSDSPWAKSVTVTASWMEESMTSNPMMAQQGSGAMQGGGAQGGPAGLGMRPHEQDAKFTALWASARTSREALARGQVLAGKVTEPAAENHLAAAPTDYLITISGDDLTPLARLDVGALSDATRLELKESKQKLAPSAIYFDRSADGSKVIGVTFHFAESVNGRPTIATGEKEAELDCKTKQVNLRFRFDLEKMATPQGRDL